MKKKTATQNACIGWRRLNVSNDGEVYSFTCRVLRFKLSINKMGFVCRLMDAFCLFVMAYNLVYCTNTDKIVFFSIRIVHSHCPSPNLYMYTYIYMVRMSACVSVYANFVGRFALTMRVREELIDNFREGGNLMCFSSINSNVYVMCMYHGEHVFCYFVLT